MPVRRYDGASFVDEFARVYNGAFSDTDDNLWAWDGADWKLIQPLTGSGSFELLPVEHLAASGISDHAVHVTWDLPVQPVIDPTEVWIRIPEISEVWMTYTYPITMFDHQALDYSTFYRVQVKLVLRQLGEVTAESAVRETFFTTLDPTVPTLGPDPGGGGGPIVVVPPPPPGCSSSWHLERTQDDVTIIVVDSGTDFITDPETGLPAVDFDTLDFEGGWMYRTCVRHTCAGVPGEWICGDWFYIPCDAPSALGEAPYDNEHLVFYIPKVCLNEIVDAVSDQAAIKGPMFAGFKLLAGDQLLTAAGEGVLAYGVEPAIVDADGPITVSVRAHITEVPTTEVGLFSYGGVMISVLPHGTGYTVRASVWEDGAGLSWISTGVDYPIVGEHTFMLRHDPVAGNLRLSADGFPLASALGTVGNRVEPFGYSIRLTGGNSWITECAVFDAILPELVDVTIDQHPAQADPTPGSTAQFAVHFSEPVSGFSASDVTITGPPMLGASVGLSGAAADYTVTVTGMTVPGVITATIPAGVVTSMEGLPNAASTSTDNTVTKWVQTHFSYTGTIQTFTVPANVHEVRIVCAAPWGGTHFGAGGGAPGGIMTATFPVIPLQVYDVRVGGGNNVFGGGPRGSSGDNGAPGGDYTCVVLNGQPLTSSLLVAGGGGGRETGQSGSTGGYPNGADGTTGQHGLGATQIAGGAHGFDSSGFGITPALDGSSFQGGRGGGSGGGLDEGGAGGGGGWFGGGGGGVQNGAHQAGGGGSGHYSAAATDVIVSNGANAGSGYVDFFWAPS